jgi:hypothetical protein
MGFFSKIARGATQFGKTVTSPNFFGKVANGVSQANNMVQKVGNFIKPIAMLAGQPEIVAGISALQGTSGQIANGLEKARSGNFSPIVNSVGGGSSVSDADNNAINNAMQFA